MIDSRRPIRWAKIERIDAPIVDVTQFEYRPERGWRWLQRAAFKVLDWIGAHHQPVVTTFVRSPQENDVLLKSLIGQEGEWIGLLHRGKGRPRIYMGPDDYPELLRLMDHRDFQPTTFEGRIEAALVAPIWEFLFLAQWQKVHSRNSRIYCEVVREN